MKQAAGGGFEPPFRGPEPRVLPLDDPATAQNHSDSNGSAKTSTLVAAHAAAGRSNAEIARVLGISKSTVSFHIGRLGLPKKIKCARRYDWDEVQRYYDEGHSITQCQARFGFARKTFMDAVARGAVVSRPHGMPIETLLVAGRRRNRNHIKGRLLRAGLKQNRCEDCGIAEWRGEPLSLALHHLNGDGNDNRLANLMLLCPNCHSQTENFGGRKVRRDRLRGASAIASR